MWGGGGGGGGGGAGAGEETEDVFKAAAAPALAFLGLQWGASRKQEEVRGCVEGGKGAGRA